MQNSQSAFWGLTERIPHSEPRGLSIDTFIVVELDCPPPPSSLIGYLPITTILISKELGISNFKKQLNIKITVQY